MEYNVRYLFSEKYQKALVFYYNSDLDGSCSEIEYYNEITGKVMDALYTAKSYEEYNKTVAVYVEEMDKLVDSGDYQNKYHMTFKESYDLALRTMYKEKEVLDVLIKNTRGGLDICDLTIPDFNYTYAHKKLNFISEDEFNDRMVEYIDMAEYEQKEKNMEIIPYIIKKKDKTGRTGNTGIVQELGIEVIDTTSYEEDLVMLMANNMEDILAPLFFIMNCDECLRF
jgi:hypothetical protein